MSGPGKPLVKGDPRAGRPKGTTNKATRALKDAILNAFEKVGGEEYLVRVAKDDQKTFCTLLARVLPMQISGEPGSGLRIEVVNFGHDDHHPDPGS